MPAPVASGWSGRRVGLAPTGKAPPFHGARGKQTFGVAAFGSTLNQTDSSLFAPVQAENRNKELSVAARIFSSNLLDPTQHAWVLTDGDVKSHPRRRFEVRTKDIARCEHEPFA